MDIIDKDDFDKAEELTSEEYKEAEKTKIFSKEDIKALQEKLDNPVELQQELAGKIKKYIDNRMAEEHEENGFISEYTRKWVLVYSDVLDKINKALYGEKSVNITLNKVSLADVGAAMRKVIKEEIGEGEDEILEGDFSIPEEEEQA